MSPVSTEIRDERLIITVDHPPVNALSHAVRAGLVEALNSAAGGEVDSVIIICAGRTFFSGADISEFGKPPKAPSLQDVILAIEACDKPVIAAIHGQALGGGFELALACDYRVLADTARIGFPEVTLGLIPGAGGTQRAPRLAGLDIALELAVTGKPMGADRAMSAGLVDMIAHGNLLEDAIGLSHHGDRQKRRLRDRDPMVEETKIFETWRAFAQQRLRGQKAPLSAIEAIEASCREPFDVGLERERTLFKTLMDGPQSRAMRHLFFSERKAGKLVQPVSAAPVKLELVGVVGAGTMGVGISAALIAAGHDVQMFDVNAEAMTIGHDRVVAIIDGDLKKGRIDAGEHLRRLDRLTTAAAWSDLAGSDLVIEAVFEDMDVKQAVLSELDAVLRPDALIASNTSYLDIDALAEMVSHPERVLGLHFFSPAHIMKLLEIVRGAKTSDTALATALALAKGMKKIGVVSGVCHGFIGNRMLSGYGREAGLLLLEGASPAAIDAAMVTFGMPMGPFAMGDMAGLDIGYANRKKLSADQYEPRAFYVHDELVERGRKGQKTAAGFYRYEPGSRAPLPDDDVDQLINEIRERENIKVRDIDEAEIVERCVYALINEGARLLGEGIAQRGSDIDVVYANGYGFPRWRGGPFAYADEIGLTQVLARINQFAAQQGERWWQAAPLLLELARRDGSLADYAPESLSEPA
jgi:3-hydroxyacyl-CoA dehydrogenase